MIKIIDFSFAYEAFGVASICRQANVFLFCVVTQKQTNKLW
jgi:hypothetical protein